MRGKKKHTIKMLSKRIFLTFNIKILPIKNRRYKIDFIRGNCTLILARIRRIS